MKTFQEWLKIKEGLWVSDGAAEQTTGGVRAKKKSKEASPGSGMAGAGGMAGGGAATMGVPMGGPGGGLSMPGR